MYAHRANLFLFPQLIGDVNATGSWAHARQSGGNAEVTKGWRVSVLSLRVRLPGEKSYKSF